MSLFSLEGTHLYWVINLDVNDNFITLHLENSSNISITIQIAWPKAQTPHPSVFLRNFKQDMSSASSFPLWLAALDLMEVSRAELKAHIRQL